MSNLLNYPPKRPPVTAQRAREQLDVVAALSATTTLLLATTDGPYAAKLFELIVPGGFAADANNYWVITLQAGATVLATYSTQTGQQGAITSGVPGSAALATPASGNDGDVLSIVCTKHGSAANLPAQTRFVAHLDQG